MAGQERSVDVAERMSDHEALMWNIEKDPWLNPSGASLTLLDRAIDMDVFVRQVRFGASKMPRLYQRVVPGFGRVSTPAWLPDPEFDLDYHIREVRLAAPGSQRQLFDLAAQLYSEPLDRTRPLWRFVVIDGLAGGKGAIWSIFHHAIADGIGQIRMAEMYQQISRDEAPRPEVDLEAIIEKAVEKSNAKELGADMSSSLVQTARRSFEHVARRNLGIAKRAVGQAAILPADPQRAVELATGAVDTARATLEQLNGSDNEVAGGSILWKERSRHRHLEYVSVSLDDLKASAKVLGGSVNDALIAVLAESAVRYHAERKVEVDAFNTSFVVSTRSDNDMGGNSFTPVPVQVSGQPLSFAERMAGVQAVAAAAKERVSQGGSIGALSGLANMFPTSVVTRAARGKAAKMDFATSNLRGAPFKLYCAGGLVQATVAMGPLAGTPMNATAMSYDGAFDVGLFIDPVAIEDPAGLRDHVAEAFADFIAVGQQLEEPVTKPKPKAKSKKKKSKPKKA